MADVTSLSLWQEEGWYISEEGFEACKGSTDRLTKNAVLLVVSIQT
ncbi:hypothetical protein FKM82_009149 [Ascaphus truei]